jgi:hypothetical protein
MSNDHNNERDARLAAMAASWIALVLQHARASSDPAAVAEAVRLYDARGLYPELRVTAPHGGGAVRVELTLRDPETDEAVASMFACDATAITPALTH